MIDKAVTNTEFKLKARPTLTSHGLRTKASYIALTTKYSAPKTVCHIALHHLTMHGQQDVSITPSMQCGLYIVLRQVLMLFHTASTPPSLIARTHPLQRHQVSIFRNLFT